MPTLDQFPPRAPGHATHAFCLRNTPLMNASPGHVVICLRSILSDLAKTASDLRQSNTRALEQLAEAVIPRLKPILDEVAAVRPGGPGGATIRSGKVPGRQRASGPFPWAPDGFAVVPGAQR